MMDKLKIHLDLLNSIPVIDIELSTFCNIQCNICPRGSITRGHGLMEQSTFNQLLEWLPKKSAITFSGMGEPLLNPLICNYIRQLGEKNIRVLLKTNGQLLDKEMIKHLIDSGIWHIQISIQGMDKDTYESNMKGARFDLLINNLKFLSSLNNAPVSIYTIANEITNKNGDAHLIEQLAKEYKLPFYNGKLHSRGGALYKPKSEGKISDEFECRIFPKAVFITWDGFILSCCHDVKGETKLGHVNNVTYKELKAIKWNILKKSKWFSICNKCDDILRHTYCLPEHIPLKTQKVRR